MPVVARSRTILAGREAVWRVGSDPHQLPRWWPRARRGEDVTPEAWTTVLQTDKGRNVRADFTRLESDRPRRLAWRQELEESPFERVLSEALTEVALESDGEGRTRVELRARQRLRGMARLVPMLFSRATRRRLDE